jgi:hypothetical protein
LDGVAGSYTILSIIVPKKSRANMQSANLKCGGEHTYTAEERVFFNGMPTAMAADILPFNYFFFFFDLEAFIFSSFLI